MKNVGIVEPSSSGLTLVTAAEEMGHGVVVFSADRDDRALPHSLRKHINELVVVDTNDEEALRRAVEDARSRTGLSAVIPGFEYYVDSVSRINASVGLPGLPPDAAESVRRKSVMRARLRKHGVRVPRFHVVRDFEDLDEAAELVKFPAVAKADDLSGSVHVTRVDAASELQAAYRAYRADTWRDMGRSSGGLFIVEEYVSGLEYSVEGFIEAPGRPFVASITRKLLGPEPSFVELGHVVEADLPVSVRGEIRQYVYEVLEALQVTLGIFHAELRLGQPGPVLMEVGARLPGDRIVELVELAKGMSLPRAMIQSYLGQRPDPWARPAVDRFAGIRFFTPGRGTYGRVSGLDEARSIPGVLRCEITSPLGTSFENLNDFRARAGHVIAIGSEHAQVVHRLTAAAGLIHFQSEPARADVAGGNR